MTITPNLLMVKIPARSRICKKNGSSPKFNLFLLGP